MFIAVTNCFIATESRQKPLFIAAGFDAATALALIIVGVLGMQLGFLSPTAAYAMLGVGAGYGLSTALIGCTSKASLFAIKRILDCFFSILRREH